MLARRGAAEFALIFFLLFAIRPMAEFTQAGGQSKSIDVALADIFSAMSILIATLWLSSGALSSSL
jgi:hypothetical protein